MSTASIVLLLAVMLDLVLGDPVYRLHPVRLIGGLIQLIEKGLRRIRIDGLVGGALLMVLTLIIVVIVQQAIGFLLWCLSPAMGTGFDVYVVCSCIALRDMLKHALPIAQSLQSDNVEQARTQLQMIVGRDVALLDAAGVARAAVESVAESFVDGFLAPLLWFGVGYGAALGVGLAPLPIAVATTLAYRVVNTLDSMVGYRNARYARFGTCSARTDDVLNFVPARLSLIVLWVAALLLRMDAVTGWKMALRDRLKHASPNSAHTESFVAGALGLRLGGPTLYAHGTVDKPYLGDGDAAATSAHIRKCSQLVLVTGVVAALVAILLIEVFR